MLTRMGRGWNGSVIRALIDTNVLFDAIAAREPFRGDAERIFLMAAENLCEGLITATSLTDIYYMTRKFLSVGEAHEALDNLMEIFAVAAVDGADCRAALISATQDFEDALMRVCAKRDRADCIVTRDAELLRTQTSIPAVSPADFVRRITGVGMEGSI